MVVGYSTLLHLLTGCPPRALRQAATLWPLPPPDPVASTLSGTQRPANLFLCKRLEAGAYQTSVENWLFPKLGILKACIPDPFSHLAARTLLKLKSKHFHWSAFAPLCADCTSVQLNLRVGELKIQSVKCSSPWLSFWLWEQRLTFKGHVHNLNTDLMPNKLNWKETGPYHPALIVAYCKRQGPVWHSDMLWSANLLHSTCSLWGGALIHWVEGTAGQRNKPMGPTPRPVGMCICFWGDTHIGKKPYSVVGSSLLQCTVDHG